MQTGSSLCVTPGMDSATMPSTLDEHSSQSLRNFVFHALRLNARHAVSGECHAIQAMGKSIAQSCTNGLQCED